VVAFDGTGFAGFQDQGEHARTVQRELSRALLTLTGEDIAVRGSSRTDAGVHALGLVINFRTASHIPLKAFHLGLNSLLPRDVAVQEAGEAPPGFDSRDSTLAKTYQYRIWADRNRNPLLLTRAWHVKRPLDLGAMNRAAAAFLGPHDFSAFRAAHCDSRSTERDIYRAEVRGAPPEVLVEVCGNAFLRNMVRIMVGTLKEVGEGRRPEGDVARLLLEGDRTQAGETAPPQGLTLVKVWQEEATLFAHLGREVQVYK
jgi:tRNA pseudouridine38-40 synthase